MTTHHEMLHHTHSTAFHATACQTTFQSTAHQITACCTVAWHVTVCHSIPLQKEAEVVLQLKLSEMLAEERNQQAGGGRHLPRDAKKALGSTRPWHHKGASTALGDSHFAPAPTAMVFKEVEMRHVEMSQTATRHFLVRHLKFI